MEGAAGAPPLFLPMTKQVFYDPQRKRWKRLRRIFDILALLGLVLGSIFVIGLVRMKPLPELFLQAQKHRFRALANPPTIPAKLRRSAHRRTDTKPGDVPLNSGEGLRAAYYVEDDPASYSSLKQHISQVDILFPEWLHVITPDGVIKAYAPDNTPYPLIEHGTVHQVDRESKVARTIVANHVNLDIFPLVNNYDPRQGTSISRSATSSTTRHCAPISSGRSMPFLPPIPAIAASPSTFRRSPPRRSPASALSSPHSTTTCTPATSASTSTAPSATPTGI